MDTKDIIQLIIALVGGGGFFGGIYMLLKLKPEAGQITVTAAQGALIVQTGVIESLQKEVERWKREYNELNTKYDELEEKYNGLKRRIDAVEEKQDSK